MSFFSLLDIITNTHSTRRRERADSSFKNSHLCYVCDQIWSSSFTHGIQLISFMLVIPIPYNVAKLYMLGGIRSLIHSSFDITSSFSNVYVGRFRGHPFHSIKFFCYASPSTDSSSSFHHDVMNWLDIIVKLILQNITSSNRSNVQTL